LLSTARLICARIQWRQIFWRKQANWVLVGFSLMLASLVDYRWIRWARCRCTRRHHLFGSDQVHRPKVYGARTCSIWGRLIFSRQLAVVAGIWCSPYFSVISKLFHRCCRPARLRRYCRCALPLILMQPTWGSDHLGAGAAGLASSSRPCRCDTDLHSFNSCRHDSNHANLVLKPYQQARADRIRPSRNRLSRALLGKLIIAHRPSAPVVGREKAYKQRYQTSSAFYRRAVHNDYIFFRNREQWALSRSVSHRRLCLATFDLPFRCIRCRGPIRFLLVTESRRSFSPHLPEHRRTIPFCRSPASPLAAISTVARSRSLSFRAWVVNSVWVIDIEVTNRRLDGIGPPPVVAIYFEACHLQFVEKWA